MKYSRIFLISLLLSPTYAYSTHLNFNDPILNTPLQILQSDAMLYRDRARTKIGQWNINNLDTSSIQALINSIATQGSKASSSCGAMSYYLEKILLQNNFNAHMLGFYAIRNDTLYLHAANYVDINSTGFMIDGHSGFVWQNNQGKLASPLAFGCQSVCYDENYYKWEYYPSTHGRQYAANGTTFIYTLEFMNMIPRSYQPATDPGLVSAIAIIKPNGDHLNTYFQLLYIFNDGRLSQKNLDQLYALWNMEGNIQSDTVIVNVDQNTCGCNLAKMTQEPQSDVQFYIPKEKIPVEHFDEPQGPPELLKTYQK